MEQEDTIPHPRVFALNKVGQWTPAVEPIQFDKPAIVGLGPGLSFGKLIAESDESVRVGLVPSAFGGTSIKQWQKGETLYEAAVERARIAMHDGKLKAVLWHQGETDTQSEDDANLYGDRLVQLIKDLRSDLGTPKVPFVVGELGRFLEFCAPVEDYDPNPKYVRKVNEAIASIPVRVPFCGFVDSTGLEDKGDSIHFSAESQRQLGIRYAREVLRLQTLERQNTAN